MVPFTPKKLAVMPASCNRSTSAGAGRSVRSIEILEEIEPTVDRRGYVRTSDTLILHITEGGCPSPPRPRQLVRREFDSRFRRETPDVPDRTRKPSLPWHTPCHTRREGADSATTLSGTISNSSSSVGIRLAGESDILPASGVELFDLCQSERAGRAGTVGVVRSTVPSCISTSAPSAVIATSTSICWAPSQIASRIDASVFSGCVTDAPRCAEMPLVGIIDVLRRARHQRKGSRRRLQPISADPPKHDRIGLFTLTRSLLLTAHCSQLPAHSS